MSNKNKTVEEQEFQQELLDNEENILSGLLAAMEDLQETFETIEIKRNGKSFFKFRVQPITAKQYETISELATKYKKNKRGVRVPEEFSASEAHARLVVEATKKEDRDQIWGNKELWKQTPERCLAPHHLVPQLLSSGEIDAIVRVIDEISGNSLDTEDMIAKEQDELDNLKN